ncbi:hypothetical protein SS50377_26593 [Spironucleus salmonicida]|uniref:Uncharacterized protein n=1 Tax=Spironucleus salmonicida TaxID=348837 RepID=V6LAG2_9EUKA|nr:hypothetical protein SS50377_26593 [Spironucleus salmonicida]|eukprot:EST41445.1 Hypothetical protein SS50377_19163 [Spironucleus salmonicida]
MILLGKGCQNIVFTDNTWIYRIAHVNLLYPRFCIYSEFHNSFTPFHDDSILKKCEALANQKLNSLTRKLQVKTMKCIIIKPKSPALYKNDQLFNYTKRAKNINAHDSQKLLFLLKTRQNPQFQLQKMGKYIQLIDCDLDLGAIYLNNPNIAKICTLLLDFYSFYNGFLIQLNEFYSYIHSESYEPYFLETQNFISMVLNKNTLDLKNTFQNRQILFQAMKSIADASIICYSDHVELIDIEMKCMKNKWNNWWKVYEQ